MVVQKTSVFPAGRDFAFRHRTEICKPFTKKYTDPSAPYDGYIEDDDTENGARNTLLGKVARK